MDISLEHDEGDDFGTLILTPGQDDHIEVSGYGERGGISIKVALYSHEAANVREVLEPLSSPPDAS
jgi:hypothetical protein